MFWWMNINWENTCFGCLMGVKLAGDVVLGPTANIKDILFNILLAWLHIKDLLHVLLHV